MNASLFRHAAVVALVGAMPLTATPAPPTLAHPLPGHRLDGAILFSRAQLDPDTTVSGSNLWLATPTGGKAARSLTPEAKGTIDGAATWSPHGTLVAFQRGSLGAASDDRYDIQLMDRRGGRLHALTTGPGNFEHPVWGPGRRIAFVSTYADRSCLSLVEYTGRQQHDLFCPPSPTQVMRPMWSSDGRAIYIAAGYYVGRIEPIWRSLAYRVDVATGSAELLTDELMDEPRTLEFSPDGRRGLYSDVYAGDLTLVDFATGDHSVIGRGYAPRWSPDGRRIAFTGEVFEDGPDFRFYEPLYVMDADGGNVRRVTRSRVDQHAYTAADWADDGVHLLVNRRLYLDPALTIPRHALRIINVDTREVTPLGDGYAEPGAWFQR